MHRVAFALAYLICVGHGRRLQSSRPLQNTEFGNRQKVPRVVKRENIARLLQPLAKLAGKSGPISLKLFAKFALAFNSITGVSGISAQYDAFLLDQFGVLHDGSQALPGAIACFNELVQRGKRCVVLSNTSRRKSDAIKKLGKLGFDSNALTGFVCSGEEAWAFMAGQCAGKKVLWLGWEDDYLGFDNAGYLRGLNVQLTTSPEEADYVLAQGTQLLRSADGQEGVGTSVFATGVVDEPLRGMLQICKDRGIPMLCANPDFQALQPDGSVGYMPGVVAKFYEAIGGKVLHFGKPFTPAFNACIDLLDGVPCDRICHVGDSLHHDIQGASDAGIDSLFITNGIHKDALPSCTDSQYYNAVRSLCEDAGARPTFVAQDFAW